MRKRAIHAGDAVAGEDRTDLHGVQRSRRHRVCSVDVMIELGALTRTPAYNNLAAQPCTTTFGVPTDLGGIDSNPRRVLFCVVGRGDGTTSTGRVGKPECGLRLQDREHVRLSKRRVYFDDQRRFELQCFLAGHQLRDAGYDQYRAGNHHRADKCHPEDRRSPLRQSHCANRCAVTLDSNNVGGCASGVILPSAGGPTLDSFGLATLLLLLSVAGVFAVNRFSS